MDLVRDALLHLYDPAQLQSHPLLSLPPAPTRRQALLDGIEALLSSAAGPLAIA